VSDYDDTTTYDGGYDDSGSTETYDDSSYSDTTTYDGGYDDSSSAPTEEYQDPDATTY
jgi:hypothetical protein